MKFQNLKNKKFGSLLVLKYLGKTKYNKSLWKCVCDCGKTTKATTGHLKSGARVSCGCLINSKDNRKSLKDLCIKEVYRQYLKNAKRRDRKFNLSLKEIENIIFNKCYYCNKKPSNIFTEKRTSVKSQKIKYNGIDRKNNNKGYDINNCVSCCKYCNIMKNDLSKTKFLNHIQRIIKNQRKS